MKRSLLFHISPTADWRWHIPELEKRFHLFDGLRIAAISSGPHMDSSDAVIREVSHLFNGIVVIPNDEVLRETRTLKPLLELFNHLNEDADSILFYAHTKGITRGGDPAVRLWTELMYYHNLDRIEAVERVLKVFPVCGAFRRLGQFGNFPPESLWHYSGTFWWARTTDLFERDWRNVPQTRYGAEAYLSMLFHYSEAGCVFGTSVGSMYNLEYVQSLRDEHLNELATGIVPD